MAPAGGYARAGSDRTACLAQTGQLQPEALVKGIASGEQPERHILLEGIIGATNDLRGSTS